MSTTRRAEERVLILAPVGRDARLAAATLGRAGLETHVCDDLAALRREIPLGAGTLLVTSEPLAAIPARDVEAWIGPEPPWSQLPLVVLTRRAATSRQGIETLRRLEQRRSATFLQRPVPQLDLVSAVRAAVESRRRQYVVRDLLEDLAGAVRQRDEFLATLGHELRNPVSAIANGLELVREDLGGLGDMGDFAGSLMHRQLQHLIRILDDLLDVSRVTRGKLHLRREDVELGALVRRVAEAFGLESADTQLQLELDGEPVHVHADPTRIEQILWNLLTNARKFSEPGGRIALTLRAIDQEAQITVCDEGRGMTRAFLRRAFDVFAQAEVGRGGLGLGLPLARRLAELHDGSLSAASEGLGRGSRFTLQLPRAEATAESAEPATRVAAKARRRVLLVEDHADLAWGIERLLQRLGQEVRHVASGREALAIAPDYRPELVLLDIGLPDMDGVEVAERLREELGPDPRIATMSGFGPQEVGRRSATAGSDRHLTKPVSFDDLQDLLRDATVPGR